MSFLRFHRNSEFKLLNPKNDLILWDPYTLYKALTLKDSVQFSSEGISFLTTSLQAPLNIPSQILQRQSFQTVQRSVNFNLSNECTRQSAISWNRSFWVLFQDISLFAIVFNVLQCVTFSVVQEQCSNTALWEKRYKSLSGMHTSQSTFSDSFSPLFIWR